MYCTYLSYCGVDSKGTIALDMRVIVNLSLVLGYLKEALGKCRLKFIKVVRKISQCNT